jgi:hypothetical protein
MQAQINGFIPPDFTGSLPAIDVRNAPAPKPSQFPPVEIRNGRELQAGADSEAQFFADTGFVLLEHRTGVENWDDVPALFAEEIEEIIRTRLFPDRRIEVQQRPTPMRRGRGTENPQYGQGVHSDGPLTAELYAANVGAFAGPDVEQWWTERYSRDDVAGFMSIDFWRTTNMAAPLRHMPLALCAPDSLDRSDILPMDFIGIAPDGRETHHLSLRYNPSQRWYFYPEMTADEVLAFKLCEFWKDQPDAPPQNCFHSAFVDPATPADAEERQSCEHRVGVLILRDEVAGQG